MYILLIAILAFVLRIIFIPAGAISFHYDMSRDAFEAQQIWKEHDLKILGPPTSTVGLYHGVLYYYLIAPIYGIGQGDPRIAAIFFSLINSLTIIPIMLLAKEIFKNSNWTILAGILFAISFEANQYGPWLSNPAPAMLTVSLFFYFLKVLQKGQKMGLYLAVLMAAFSTQFQFFLIYLFILLPIFIYLFKIKINKKQLGISVIVAIFALSNFLVALVKFNTLGQVLRGFLEISVSSQINSRTQFSEFFLNYLNRFSDLFINNFLPTNVFLGGLLGFIVLYFARKERFILFCLLSNFSIFIFGGHSNTYVNIGLVTPAILGVCLLVQKLWQQKKWIGIGTVSLIIVANLYTHYKNSPQGQVTLVIPKDMVLKNQLQLIDKTYEIAQRQPFSINTLTLPLWTNTTWAYLYEWYGKKKYGYVPKFYGRDQIGLLGNKSLEKIDKPLKKSFFIIEPHTGIPVNFFNQELIDEDARTKLIQEVSFNSLRLQYRTPRIDAK